MSHAKEMTALGFELKGSAWRKGDLQIRFGKGSRRPYYAMLGKTSLCANGDMIGSGTLRKFATPANAARAAIRYWNLP